MAKAFCPVERYGGGVLELEMDQPGRTGTTSWTVLHDDKPWAELEFPLAGEYNVWNATAAAALAASWGIPKDAIAAALKTFKSVKRRLEVKALVNGITIIDDFAHHPTAIAGTLKALRARYPGAACGQFSNRAPTRCAGAFCRVTWRAAWLRPMK